MVTDELTGDEWTVASLAPGANQTFNTTYTVTAADAAAGTVVNTATATSDPIVDPEDPDDPIVPGVVPGTDPEPTVNPPIPVPPAPQPEPEPEPVEFNPHLTVNKEVTSTAPQDGGYKAGDVISYRITVTNDGDADLTGVTVSDALTGDTWTVGTLAAGASRTFNTTYVVTEADAERGSVSNTATAAGTGQDPNEPDNPDAPAEVTPGTAEVPVITVIEPDNPPLADQSSWSLVDVLATVGSVGTSIGAIALYFKKKKEDEDGNNGEGGAKAAKAAAAAAAGPAGAAAAQGDDDNVKKHGVLRALTAIPGIGSIVGLFLTQDFTAPMIITDKWTIAFVGALVVNGVLAYLSKKKKEEPEDEAQKNETPKA